MQIALAAALCSLLLLRPGANVDARQAERGRTPKKGDTVVVKGCLNGPTLEATETVALDETGDLYNGLTYQLKGDKGLLKRLRGQHDGQVVEVTGKLKSTLPDAGAIRGKEFGRTRIIIGMGASPRDRMTGIDQPLPVLEVQSFEGTTILCR